MPLGRLSLDPEALCLEPMKLERGLGRLGLIGAGRDCRCGPPGLPIMEAEVTGGRLDKSGEEAGGP